MSCITRFSLGICQFLEQRCQIPNFLAVKRFSLVFVALNFSNIDIKHRYSKTVSTALCVFTSKEVNTLFLAAMDCVMEPQASVLHVQVTDADDSLVELDASNFGCTHYRRRCKIRAPCCDEIFSCRHCHNEAKNSFDIDPPHRHDVPRHEVTKVICALCDTEQEVRQNCINCGVRMGNYFCQKCKFFDDDVSKNQYHCDQCGICRTGGQDNFFHCDKCGCCYSKAIKDTHVCVERAMHHDCPICSEFLFDSLKDLTILRCGHTMHLSCLEKMEQHHRYSCPVCSKSICDLSSVWEKLDHEVEVTPMPESYQDKMVWILCNDCEKISQVQFHIVGHKCMKCKSYNTRQIRGGPSEEDIN